MSTALARARSITITIHFLFINICIIYIWKCNTKNLTLGHSVHFLLFLLLSHFVRVHHHHFLFFIIRRTVINSKGGICYECIFTKKYVQFVSTSNTHTTLTHTHIYHGVISYLMRMLKYADMPCSSVTLPLLSCVMYFSHLSVLCPMVLGICDGAMRSSDLVRLKWMEKCVPGISNVFGE